ncbi:hypothetical protein EON64_10250 [archaeon]|nr:MAG: hypothetical protein EON64_10250 [archaeon]
MPFLCSDSPATVPKFRVAVIGGGPSGSCAAEALAQNPQIECVLFERKMDNAKPCGGAIPLCMVEEFKLPPGIIDRKVRKMKLISPSNREADIGHTLGPDEYIGMTRREVLDSYLRDRAISYGARAINALVTEIAVPNAQGGKYTISYAVAETNVREVIEADYVIGADGANGRVAKAMGAGMICCILLCSYCYVCCT